MGFRKATTKKETKYMRYTFPYSFSSFRWAETRWESGLNWSSKSHPFSVFSARRERSRGRASLGVEAFLELPAVPRPCVLLCALSQVRHSPSLSSPGRPCVHPIPVRKLRVLWLREMRHHVGCLNVLLVLYVNLRSFTFIPFKMRGSSEGLHKKPQSSSLAKMCDLLPGNYTFCNILRLALL